MKRVRYSIKLMKEVSEFAFKRKIFWLIPLLLLMLPIALLVVGGEVVSPLIYTIF